MTRPLLIALTLVAFSNADARSVEPIPVELQGIDVQERLGSKVDTNLTFINHEGKTVTLGDFFDGKRPVLLTLNYYQCPLLCGVQLNQLADGLKNLQWTAGGDEFTIVTVSFDPRDELDVAKGKRANILTELDRGEDVGWEFLLNPADKPGNAKALAEQLGFKYTYDEETKQYAHAPVVFVMSPDGTISRYLYGLNYAASDLRFGLMEAAAGRIGSTLERVLLSCYQYDATRGDYTASALGIMRLGGIFTMLLLGSFLTFYWLRERRHSMETSA
jgi:protein SCO1/2